MANENEKSLAELYRNDRVLFSTLLKHVVQAAPNEDPSDFVLASIGQNVGADRCYVYWFWEPGKSSMCTNTHEWCAEGIKPEIAGQQTCNLADLVEFNAHITSGRDFLFTDIDAIDVGSREWLEPQGIKSLIATPLIGANNTVCGFAGFDFVTAPCAEFTDRIVSNIHEAADLLLNCQRLHERDIALQDVSQRESERDENEREFERALMSLQSDARTMHPRQMLEIVRKRLDADVCYLVLDIRPEGGGTILPEHALARSGWTNTRSWNIDSCLGRALATRLMTSPVLTLREGEIAWMKASLVRDEPLPDAVTQLKTVHCIGIRHEGSILGVLCVGYVQERSLTAPQLGFLKHSALIIVSVLERISTYHDLAVALTVSHLKGEVVEFMFKHQAYAEIRDFIGEKVCAITGAQHLMLCADDGSRSDWFGDDAPPCCHNCVKAAVNYGKDLPENFFSQSESVIIKEGESRPDMNLPRYCPMHSSVVSQFRRNGGWWRLVADYTKPHKHNLNEVASGLRAALELLAIAHDRERHEQTISRMQEHQRFRADTLAYALAKNDIPGLIDLTLHRLLDLTDCDYIAIHSVDGDHRLLFHGKELEKCPGRCEECSFYKLLIPPVESADHIIELNDAKGQTLAPIASSCPAQSLEVAVVYCEGKPWGGIALHYLKKQREISDDVRRTLKSAANVLTLALERHAAATRLKAERDRVVEAEKTRSYFFSAVSHDIRTPLNAIIGFSELLQSDDIPQDEAREYLSMIVASGKTLLHLINDVLDLSKMDLGKLEFNLEPTDIGELMREILPAFQPMMVSGQQTLVLDVPVLPRLMIDPHRYKQVLFNFISNAVKYAGPCTIHVSAAYEDGLVKTTVSDNGKGVSAEKAKLLMQPFVQADIKNRTEGSGLGLAICRRLVELAHGTISIETAPGTGFSIHTEVPVEVADGEKKVEQTVVPAEVVEPSNLPRRILVVDDSPANLAVLKAMLKKMGVADIELAGNGKVALEMLQGDPTFDLVLSDMWMPVMDGAELAGRIRADARLSKMKVCAITADVEARTTYGTLGFDAILLKPVTFEKISDLFNLLAK